MPPPSDLGEQYQSVGVFVYGPTARYKDFTAIKHACTTNSDGTTECSDDDSDAPARKKQKTSSPAEPPPTAGTSQSTGGQQGASCIRPEQCDIANNYACVSAQNAPPTDPTWGQYTCQFIPNAAVAIAAAAPLLKSAICRGRCLLGENGTLEIPSQTTSILSVASPQATIVNQLAGVIDPALACPCNCTYVSQLCCLSRDGLVFEDAAEEVVLRVVEPPNGTLCCDATTGDWAKAPVVRDTPGKTSPICEGGGGGATVNT